MEAETLIEPVDYFADIKNKLIEAKKDDLAKQVGVLQSQILLAKEIGQTAFLHKLSFAYRTIEREIQAIAGGWNHYVLEKDIKTFIDKVTPKHSVKIIELERFPRAIPVTVLEKIKVAQAAKIFDNFVVVFTDFTGMTNETVQTEAEKAVVARNKDPIVFGYFTSPESGIRYDKFYFIDDWIDEYCDLDYSKMIEKMTALGIQNPDRELAIDPIMVSNIVESVMNDMIEKAKPRWDRDNGGVTVVERPVAQKVSFFQKVKNFIVENGKIGAD
jgi:hypothetical protein